jgi:hypothetical protein
MSFWKRLMGRGDDAARRHAEESEIESPREQRTAAEGVDGIAADENVAEHLGGVDPKRLVDDEFTQ